MIAGDIGDLVVGPDQDFLGSFGDVDGLHDRKRLKIDDGDLVHGRNGCKQPPSIDARSGAEANTGERDPGLNGVRGGIDDSQLRLGLIGGKDHRVVRRDGDALRILRDWNDLDHFARIYVEHGDGAWSDVGRVSATAIVREGQHVRFGLAGRDSADDLVSPGVDDRDGLIEFGGDVKETVFRTDFGAVRADTLIEFDIADDLSCCEIDNGDFLAIGSGLTNSRVAVDRDESSSSIFGGNDFMPGHAAFGHLGDLFACLSVDDA